MTTFAEQMVSKYEGLLLKGAGLSQVTVDGTVVSFVELEQQYAFWTRRVARESGARPVASTIKLGGM